MSNFKEMFLGLDTVSEKKKKKDSKDKYTIKCPECGHKIESPKGKTIPAEGMLCPECDDKVKMKREDD